MLTTAIAANAQPGNLNGTYRSSTGKVLTFVNLVLIGTGKRGITDKNCQFTLTGLPDGEYRLVVSMVGHGNGVKLVRVPSKDSVALVLEERIVDARLGMPRAFQADLRFRL